MRHRKILLALFSAAAAFALVLSSACGGDDPTELIVLTHDSFDASEELIAQFEEEHGITVTLVEGGDANQIVNRAILNAGNPEADVMFGIDNLNFARAAEEDVFEKFEADRRSDLPADVLAQFDDSELVTPIDYGFVNLNFDRSAGTPPATLQDLTTEEWRGKFVVQDPATSSPGLQFLATTVAQFGEGGWQDYWRALKANDVLVTDGWTEAYYTSFSVYGGDRTVVVSYTTSPAAEVFFGEDLNAEPPTLNVQPGPIFRQVEAAAILRGTKAKGLAGDFIDFMLTDAFQAQIPQTMFVNPVVPGVETPDWWRWAEVDVTVATLDVTPDEIDRWIDEWTEIMRR
jgi:thiamine transport system substrate-binding protein